jgi:preprotein translocase subunit SecY
MWEKLALVWKLKEVRQKLLVILGLLILFRLVAHIPVPGVNITALNNFFQSNQLFGLLNVFSGGGYDTFSVVMLGVGPYITASIIFQLLTMIVPSLEKIQKEGERGQEQINRWTRYLAVPMAILQGYGTITLIRRASPTILPELNVFQFVTILITITAGTLFLMWIGEIISEKKLGNGISLMIFAGIIARVPSEIQQTAAIFDSSNIMNYAIFAAVGILTIMAVVFVTEAVRKIPVTYARHIRGAQASSSTGAESFLPLRVNQAGVIPIIFAVSLILTPTLIAQFFVNASQPWLRDAAGTIIRVLQQGTVAYDVSYFLLVFIFTYFYTAVVFQPQQVAENIQKQGGFIPGIRPGKMTADYLNYVTNRIMLAGAGFLGIIALLPNLVQRFTNITTLIVGGTSLLIVVSVVIETVKQIESQLIVRDYEGF